MAVDFANDTMRRAGALYTDYPENIIIMPELNGRHEHTDVEDLAADIAAHGQIEPVGIRKSDQGLPVLIYGHRRYRAVCLLNERNPEQPRKLLCTYTPLTDMEAFMMAIRENRCRKDVSPIDDCANITTLRKLFALTDEDIAAVYFPEAKTDEEKAEALRFVKQRAALVELAPEAAQAVRDGRVKITAAVGLAKLTKDQQRTKVAGTGKVKVKDVTKAAASQPTEQPTAPETAAVTAIDQPATPAAQPANGKRKDQDSDAYKVSQLAKAFADLMKEVEIEDLTNPDVEFVSVSAMKMLAMSHMVDRYTGKVTVPKTPAEEREPEAVAA
jgi:ParB-like chromosome segregation protein Spo0J